MDHYLVSFKKYDLIVSGILFARTIELFVFKGEIKRFLEENYDLVSDFFGKKYDLIVSGILFVRAIIRF